MTTTNTLAEALRRCLGWVDAYGEPETKSLVHAALADYEAQAEAKPADRGRMDFSAHLKATPISGWGAQPIGMSTKAAAPAAPAPLTDAELDRHIPYWFTDSSDSERALIRQAMRAAIAASKGGAA